MKPLTKAQRAVLEKMADGYVLHKVEHWDQSFSHSIFLSRQDRTWIRGIRGATLSALCERKYIERRGPSMAGGTWQITDAGRKEVKASKPD